MKFAVVLLLRPSGSAETWYWIPAPVVKELVAAFKRIVRDQAGRDFPSDPIEHLRVVEIELADKPGALGDAATKLGKAGVNITHVFVGTGGARKATVFLGVSDAVAAAKALR